MGVSVTARDSSMCQKRPLAFQQGKQQAGSDGIVGVNARDKNVCRHISLRFAPRNA